MTGVLTKRVYEPAADTDGARVLIMRLWPRGIRKAHAGIWLKELGPVPTLLRAFLDGKLTWAQYRPRYLAGLARPEAQAAVAEVRRLAAQGPVTLLCGCADETRCHRSLLQAYLLDSRRGAPGARRRPDRAQRRHRRGRA
jgi:uncharacterized protein YeaO (DUF488 family)